MVSDYYGSCGSAVVSDALEVFISRINFRKNYDVIHSVIGKIGEKFTPRYLIRVIVELVSQVGG